MAEGTTVGRRGLIAGAAALTAALVAKRGTQPVAAASVMTTDTINVATGITGIATPGAVGFQGQSTQAAGGAGLVGFNAADGGIGTKGLASNGIGVQGGIGALGAVAAANTLAVQGVNFATGTGSTGVQGLIDSLAPPATVPNALGVEGRNNSVGTGSIGVLGTIGVNGDNSSAVTGLNLSTAPTTFGVSGQSNGSNGAGIIGSNSTSGVGLQGQSVTGHGLTGVTNAGDGIHSGVFAFANASGGVALQASGVAGSTAGLFRGNVTITGNLVVNGSFNQKNAAIPHPTDGTTRLLHCMEAPEAWFEDFGEATLAGGTADVKMDADFAAFADMRRYHVFLTAYGPQQLYVSQRGAAGFTVTAIVTADAVGGPKRPEAAGTFSWRVVAKRKDSDGIRFKKFTPPKGAGAPTIHDLPVPPKYEEIQKRALAAIKQ